MCLFLIIRYHNYNFFIIETDNNLIFPFNYQIILTITSIDVIHSWTIPSLNIKIDAIPNQLNNIILITYKPNIIYGQCSEICGINHRFIPIKIESINIINFLKLNILIKTNFILKYSIKINFIYKIYVFKLALKLKTIKKTKAKQLINYILQKVIAANNIIISAIATAFINVNFFVFLTL